MKPASTQTVDKIKFSKSIFTKSKTTITIDEWEINHEV